MAAGERPLPPIVIEAILARTEGVPLFVEELTKAVLESASGRQRPAMASRARRPTSAAGDSGDARRFADGASRPLGSGAEVAQIAACIGREFDEDVVGAIAGYPEPQLAAALGQLCRRD